MRPVCWENGNFEYLERYQLVSSYPARAASIVLIGRSGMIHYARVHTCSLYPNPHMTKYAFSRHTLIVLL